RAMRPNAAPMVPPRLAYTTHSAENTPHDTSSASMKPVAKYAMTTADAVCRGIRTSSFLRWVRIRFKVKAFMELTVVCSGASGLRRHGSKAYACSPCPDAKKPRGQRGYFLYLFLFLIAKNF